MLQELQTLKQTHTLTHTGTHTVTQAHTHTHRCIHMHFHMHTVKTPTLKLLHSISIREHSLKNNRLSIVRLQEEVLTPPTLPPYSNHTAGAISPSPLSLSPHPPGLRVKTPLLSPSSVSLSLSFYCAYVHILQYLTRWERSDSAASASRGLRDVHLPGCEPSGTGEQDLLPLRHG